MNKRKNKLLKIGSLLSVLVLCGCSYIQPLERGSKDLTMTKNNIVNVKRSYNPMDTGDNVSNLDLKSIFLPYNIPNTTMNMYYMQYYEYYGFHQQNDDDGFFFYIDLDNNYNFTLNVETYNISNTTFKIRSLYLPLADYLDDYSNTRLYVDFDLNYNVSLVSFGTLNEGINWHDNIENNLYNSYGFNYFNQHLSTSQYLDNGYSKGSVNVEYSYNSANTYLYIVFDRELSFNFPSGSNNLTFPLGKMHIYSDNFPHNAIYTNDVDNIYNTAYNDGFANGQESGKAIGRNETIQNTYQGKTYQQIYNIGYSDGETATSGTTTLIPSLFGAIVNIPISILNGLVPLTFFDISIIRVALTFLALGVVMWIIRKVLI